MSYRKLLDRRLAEDSLEIVPVFEIGSSDQICRLLAESNAVSRQFELRTEFQNDIIIS